MQNVLQGLGIPSSIPSGGGIPEPEFVDNDDGAGECEDEEETGQPVDENSILNTMRENLLDSLNSSYEDLQVVPSVDGDKCVVGEQVKFTVENGPDHTSAELLNDSSAEEDNGM